MTGDVGGAARSEEHHGVGDLLGAPPSLEREAGLHRAHPIVAEHALARELEEHPGLDDAEQHGVGADAVHAFLARDAGDTPIKEYIAVERPDYLDVQYEMNIWCDYMEQLNKVVEQIIFFQGRSFGDRFKFQIKGDGYNFETITDAGDDRIVRASITLVSKAYIVPEFVGMNPNNRKVYSVGKISFTENPQLSGQTNPQNDFI